MSLRKALDMLPGDRDTERAAREVLGYLKEHPGEFTTGARIARVTGVSEHTVEVVLRALRKGFVVDCDGESSDGRCRFVPDTVLKLEVDRYLRTADDSALRLQRSVDRFRGRYGAGR